ncbi:MAG: AEC family transporter [Verrucomicrobiota bacterium]
MRFNERMFTYTSILAVLAPVFILIGIGAVLRKANWLNHNADELLFRIVINIFYPALVIESIIGRETLRDPKVLILAPLLGSAIVAARYLFCWGVAKITRFPHHQQRSFAFAASSINAGFIGIPLAMGLFDKDTLAVYIVCCAGADMTYWALAGTVSEQFTKIDWRKIFNIPFLAIFLSSVVNLVHPIKELPYVIQQTLNILGSCYLIGVILIGSLAAELLMQPHSRPSIKTMFIGGATHTLILPLLMIVALRYLPIINELKSSYLIFASICSALSAFMVVKYYKGHAPTAFAITLTTAILSIVTTPLWIKFGFAFLNLSK